MMTLLAFTVIIAVIVAIARFNEDEKLFWQLLVSFVGAYAAVTAVNSLLSDKKQNEVVMVEKAPMQALEGMPTLTMSVVTDNSLATRGEKSPKPAGKDMLLNQSNNILSEVHRKARGQPQWEMYFSDS
jgi:hypothetical protein